MSHINVYVESFTEHIPSRMVPVASIEDIRSAIAQVQATDDLYRNDDGQLIVDEEWHAAAVLDFGEWLMTHMPSFNEALLCYNFEEFSIIRDWMKYNAVERTEEVNELIAELWSDNPPAAEELAQAHVIADMLLQHGAPMTVSTMADIRGLDSIYVPAVSTSMGFTEMAEADLDKLASMSETDDAYWSFLSELMVLALVCVKNEVAVLSYTVHATEGMEAVGMFLFAEGHVVNMPREYFPSIMDYKTSDEETLAENLSSFVPRDKFEHDCSRLAAGIMFALHEALTATYEHTMKHSAEVDVLEEEDRNVELSLVDAQGVVLGHNLLDEYAALPAPLSMEFDNLADMFDAAMEVSPFVENAESTKLIAASCVASGACELLLTGKMEHISELVCDLFQVLDFGLADIDIDFEVASTLEEHAELMESYKELELSEEVFSQLPEEQRREVFTLVDTIQLDSSSMRTIVSLEGDLDEEDLHMGAVKATALKMPGIQQLPEDSNKEMNRLLQQMCIQAFHSPSTTMFVSSRGMRPNQVNLSAVQWRNGHWEDIGEDKAMMYLMSSNIGSQLDILPGDDIEYRGFRS